ncbi:MAG: hypothetical protein DRP74_06795 [Candidatus Omnitrophota bacterium]|nr:MAG: hypothetical protein DRP74_06795 [Candidatus Omnitrophota bacterium]
MDILLILCYLSQWAGTATRFITLLNTLSKRINIALIITERPSPEVFTELQNKVSKIFIIPSKNDTNKNTILHKPIKLIQEIILLTVNILKLRHTFKYDVIYVIPPMQNILASLISSIFTRKPVIVELHTHIFSNIKDKLLRSTISLVEYMFLQKANGVIVNSPIFKKHLIVNRNVDSEKILIVPNFVDTQLFDPRTVKYSKHLLRYKYETIVTYISFLKEEEDPFTIIKAAKIVLQECPSVFFVIVGSGPLEYSVKRMIKKFDLEDKILFLGQIPHLEIPSILKSTHIFVATRKNTTSTKFATPIKILEAMAMEIPVITTSLPPIEKLFGDVAIMIPAGDYISLAREIIKLVKNEDLRKKIGRDSRKAILKYKPENIGRNLHDFLKQITRVCQ